MSAEALLVDLGNSRCKWARAHAGRLLERGSVPAGEPLPEFPTAPRKVAVAATGADAHRAELRALLARRCPGVPVRWAASEAGRGGLRNSYREPLRMGVDRWLAMLAAWEARRGALCVVDAGTALTVDVVNDAGAHQGGWIVPGLALMRRSLARNTARVGPELEAGSGPWGSSTGQAVALGTAAALEAAAAAGVRRFTEACPAGAVFLTGGDGERLLPAIASHARSVRLEPDLVLLGLLRWLEGGDPGPAPAPSPDPHSHEACSRD